MKFNFTSQICTTKEQSERLLAMGLRRETADCVMMYYDGWHIGEAEHFDFDKDPVEPAWSLHRLIDMLTYQVIYNNTKSEPIIALDGMAYQDVCSDDAVVGWSGDLYTDVIDCIEWLISIEQFNKEYLEEKK